VLSARCLQEQGPGCPVLQAAIGRSLNWKGSSPAAGIACRRGVRQIAGDKFGGAF
tara:strand:+ start:3235 stop:3399 length:165 start_codon:yes stop_codon:yes gene_type:complete